MKNITFLLPLKDRAFYTKRWLQYNILPEYNYYIADGGLENENQNIFKDVYFSNVTYTRYPEDRTSHDFIKKMHHAASTIKTKYVMLVDNDDFINFKGVEDCINVLQKKNHVVCAGGIIYGVQQINNKSEKSSFSLPIKAADNSSIQNLSGLKAIRQLFKKYSYLWYSVFRADENKQIWEDIKTCNISNLFLVEILHAKLAICYGKYAHSNCNHYIRLYNPITSCAKELSSHNKKHYEKLFYDYNYTDEVFQMSSFVASKFNMALGELMAELLNYYNCQNKKSKWPNKSKIISVLLGNFASILQKMGFRLSLQQCFSYINFICTIRAALRI